MLHKHFLEHTVQLLPVAQCEQLRLYFFSSSISPELQNSIFWKNTRKLLLIWHALHALKLHISFFCVTVILHLDRFLGVVIFLRWQMKC